MSAVLLLLSLTASAFAPDARVHTGSEPTLIRRFDPVQQEALRRSEGWRGFRSGVGAGWVARFSEHTGLPARAFGPPIPLAEAGSEASVDRSVRAALGQSSAGVIGVPWSSLRLGHAQWVPSKQAWILRYDQVLPVAADPAGGALRPEVGDFGAALAHGQATVYGGALHVWVQDGAITSFSAQTFPEAEAGGLSLAPRLSRAAAREIAQRRGPDPRPSSAEGEVLIVLPVETALGVELRLCWQVRTTVGGTLPARYVSFVDAETGRLWNVHNEVRYLSGELLGRHPTRATTDPLIDSPLAFLRVSGSGGGSDDTDLDGVFDVSGESASARLRDGVFFDVDNRGGSDAAFSWSDSSAVWTTSDASQAELSSYVFLNAVRLLWDPFIGDTDYSTERMSSSVNINDVCNAYYDGNVNFFRAGSGCNNTGELLDVNFHEWGHGLHAYAAGTFSVDGSVGEGAADTVAFLYTADSVMARGFMTDGSGIREVASNRVYPDDVVDQVHTDGLIFGGGGWDLWGLLRAELGDAAALPLMQRLLVDGLRTNPGLADAYDAYLFADDDNGDLSDGTPNQCALIEAWALHGLGPGGGSGGLLALDHDALDDQPEGLSSYPLSAEVLNLAPGCLDSSLSEATVVYSVDGGDWARAPLSVSGDRVEGAIPAQPAGSVVSYYLEGVGGTATTASPVGGEITPYTFVVGELSLLWCSDFEDDDAGFTSALLAGEDIEGANDWQWDGPRGQGGDPSRAFSGRRVWGTDLAPDRNWNGQYQDDRHTRLSSPPIDVSGYGRVVLQYQRWLQVEDGVYDQANILANEALVWTNFASRASDGSKHHLDAAWNRHSVVLPVDSGELSLAWEIVSDGGLTFGGWNIDDVCVYGVVGSTGGADGGADGGVDGAADGGDVDGEPTVDDTGAAFDADGLPDDQKVSACACAAGSPGPLGAALPVAVVAGLSLLRRRRR